MSEYIKRILVTAEWSHDPLLFLANIFDRLNCQPFYILKVPCFIFHAQMFSVFFSLSNEQLYCTDFALLFSLQLLPLCVNHHRLDSKSFRQIFMVKWKFSLRCLLLYSFQCITNPILTGSGWEGNTRKYFVRNYIDRSTIYDDII